MNLVLVTNQLVLFRLNPFVSSSLLKGCKQRAEEFGEIWASRGFATSAFFFPHLAHLAQACPRLARDLPDPLSELRLRSSALLPLRSPTYACPFCSIFFMSKVAPFVLFFLSQKLPLLFYLSYVKSCSFCFLPFKRREIFNVSLIANTACHSLWSNMLLIITFHCL